MPGQPFSQLILIKNSKRMLIPSRFSTCGGCSRLTRHFYIPLTLSILIVFAFSLYYGSMLPVGSLHRADEYKTLDRSQGFIANGDWLTVYWKNNPSFRKPPLQYWLTAVSLERMSSVNVASRLPSYIFGLVLLLATACLASLLNNSNPYSAPTAIVLLSTSSLFWEMSVSAMLDTGMVLFSVIAVTGTLLALRQPRYWYLVAAAVGIGSLQKAPVAAVLVATIIALLPLTHAHHNVTLKSIFSNKHFRWAALIAFLISASWPVLQTSRYGSKAIIQAYGTQMWERFNPFGSTEIPSDWTQVFLAPEAIIWIPAILSTAAIPFLFRRFEAIVPLVIVCGFFLVMGIASGDLSSRYPLLILPFLAASFAAALTWLPGQATGLVLAAGLCLLGGGPLKNAESLALMNFPQEKYRPLLEKFRLKLRPDETLIVCGWRTDATSPTTPLFHESISYYASEGHRLYTIKDPKDLQKRQHAKQKIKPPYRGLCALDAFGQLKKFLVDYEIADQSEGYVHWESNRGAWPK